MNALPKYITDEHTGLKYELVGDYYFLAGDDEPEEIHIGVWGQEHYQYLRKNKPFIISTMRYNGTLYDYIKSVDDTAQSMYDDIVSKLAKQEGVTEKLKSDDQMTYVRIMNNVCDRAREIVLSEVVYQ